jgi:hypothetical protein
LADIKRELSEANTPEEVEKLKGRLLKLAEQMDCSVNLMKDRTPAEILEALVHSNSMGWLDMVFRG